MRKSHVQWRRRYREIQGDYDDPLPPQPPAPSWWRDPDVWFTAILIAGLATAIIWGITNSHALAL